MLFNSIGFIFLFLPITFSVYFILNHKGANKISKIFLVSSSLFFYSWWNIIYLPIIVVSMVFNYFIGSLLLQSKIKINTRLPQEGLLIVGIIFNLGLLGYFKYSDFFIENLNLLFGRDIVLLHLTLPLAISFFTFQQIAYLVDSYKKETSEYNFLNYALFVTFFPQLIAGPIVHHKEMMPQFSNRKNFFINSNNIAQGLFVFSIGLFKKVILADTFAIWANAGFDTTQTLNFYEAWGTSLSYTFQLYFDFSGYTDMAIGLALLFNIRIPINFNSPYKSLNIQDFWRRWHITLSRFLRDYVYIPLGGNQKGSILIYVNLMATFIIGGIWHGAGWTFIFWGFLHGFALVIHRLWMKLNLKIWNGLAWFLTFMFVNFAWVFFRATSWDKAIKLITEMFNVKSIGLSSEFGNLINYLNPIKVVEKLQSSTIYLFLDIMTLEFIMVGFVIVLFSKNSNEYSNKFEKSNVISIPYLLFTILALGT